ncbi:MAG: GNAT family N-acetyltransferase [Alphaproteobacteria bacterium]
MTHLRKILPRDISRLIDHLQRLDSEDRRLRFGRPVGDRYIEDFVAGLDWDRALSLGYFDGQEIRATGLLARRADGPRDEAEIALTVEPDYRRLGLGLDLLRRLAVLARNRGIRHLDMMMLAENEGMRGLARKFGAVLTPAGSEITGRIDLAAPDLASWWQEASDDGAALVHEAIAQWRPLLAGRRQHGPGAV